MSDSEKPKSWRERDQFIKHKWFVPFIYVEWRCEQLSKLLEQWAFLDILKYLGRFAILVAVFFYFAEAGDRQMTKHYQAWQIINSAQAKAGSGGRMDALEDLNRDRVPLTGIDLSGAHLRDIELKRTLLREAKLSESDLTEANLTEADFTGADIVGTKLTRANLSNAVFLNANLTDVLLFNANLRDADFTFANLFNAKLGGADLTNANLSDADISNASFQAACFNGANLMNIRNWQKIESIEFANISNVKNPPTGFINWANEQGAVEIEDEEEWKKFLEEKR